MKIKQAIGYLLAQISTDDLKCNECGLLFKDKTSTFCGLFDENIKNNERCSACIYILESVESNALLRLKYKWTKKDEKIIGKI